MDKVNIIGEVENDVKVPNSTKYSTNKENVFVYDITGKLDNKARQAITNSIQAHGGKNGFTAKVTFNSGL